MARRSAYLVSVALLLALAAPASANDLAGWTWKVRSLGGERVPRDFGDRIRFGSSKVVARVHCNRVRAPYLHVNGFTLLEFGKQSSTRRACGSREEPALALPEAMRRTQGYQLSKSKKRLTLAAVNADGDGLVHLAKLERVGRFRPGNP